MKRLFPIFLFITALLSPCCAQTVPSEALQQAMQRDETAFLQSMSPTLQHTQALAVRMAIQGDARALQQIRERRNVAYAARRSKSSYAHSHYDFISINATHLKATPRLALSTWGRLVLW